MPPVLPNSLTLAGLEMIGVTTDPQYRLATGIDFGEILPATTTISSLLLDGDIVSGDRTGNKTWNLTIRVMSQLRTRVDLSAQIDALLLALNVDSFPVTFTPGGCATGVVQTRGRPTLTVTKDLIDNDSGAAEVTVTFQTGPFLSSTALQTITVTPVGGPGQLQIDGMNSGTFVNGVLSTVVKFEGAGSCTVTATRTGSGPFVSPLVGRAIGAVDLSSYPSFSARLQWVVDSFTVVTVVLTFSSASGGSASVTAPLFAISPGDSSWHLVTFAAADLVVSGTFDVTDVDSWSFTVKGLPSVGGSGSSQLNLDDLRAYPAGSVGNATTEGAVYNVPAIVGSARTPVAIEAARAGVAQTSGNLLSAQDSSLEASGVGSWGFTTNCTLARVATGFKGSDSLEFTAMGSGNMSAFVPTGTTQMPVTPNTTYTLIASSHAVATARSFNVGVFWSDINGVIVGSANTGSFVDATSGFVTAQANVTSPPDAVSANLAVTYVGCATSEKHDLDGIGLIVGASQPWVAGTGSYITVPLTFTNLLLHSPPASQDPDLTIFAGLGAGSVVIPAANMNYDGTYSLVGLITASASGARTVTVTITQKIGTTTIATLTWTQSITGTLSLVTLQPSTGDVALPLVKQPPENSNGSLTIAISSTGDTWSDVAIIDTRGQTVLLTGLASTNDAVWIDQPDPLAGVGDIYQSATDRTGAFYTPALISGGPMLFEPGNNKLVAASTNGAPTLTFSYPPAWLDEAQQ